MRADAMCSRPRSCRIPGGNLTRPNFNRGTVRLGCERRTAGQGRNDVLLDREGRPERLRLRCPSRLAHGVCERQSGHGRQQQRQPGDAAERGAIALRARLKGGSTLDWTPAAGSTTDADSTSLLTQMHQATEQTLVQGFLQFWTPFVDGSVVPANSSGLDVTHGPSTFTLHSASNGTDVTEVFQRSSARKVRCDCRRQFDQVRADL